MNTPAQVILQEIERLQSKWQRPIVVALDGGSGAGKTTVAGRLMLLTEIALVPLDDFYQTLIPESEWPHRTVKQRLNGVFDWSRFEAKLLNHCGQEGRAVGLPLTSCVV